MKKELYIAISKLGIVQWSSSLLCYGTMQLLREIFWGDYAQFFYSSLSTTLELKLDVKYSCIRETINCKS